MHKIVSLDAISTPQPEFTETQAKRVLAEDFGLQGTLVSLLSERDQNFRVSTDDGHVFVFKIANGAECDSTTDFQIKALLHIEQQQCPVATPRVHRTLDGNEFSLIHDRDTAHVCRVVSYLPGVLLSEVAVSPQLAAEFGRGAARLDLALANFDHAAENQVLLWDLQRASGLRQLLKYVAGADLRAALSTCLDDFDSLLQPVLPSLRRQVIHGDLNADNVLVQAGGQDSISGVIDFGDMLHAPLIVEVAIAAAYLRVADGDVLSLIAPFVAGFNSVLPLQDAELVLLFDLIRARLAATITILHWRAAMRGADDEYSRRYLQHERTADTFLARLDSQGRSEFGKRIKNTL